ncbi:MAG: IreB family regulatory phosphoprotein [Christensenellales bacterium]
MGDQTNETVHFKIQKERTKAGDVLMRVYEAMSERGYDPVNQIVGYLISGDPTYITSYNNARYLIRMLERDELLEELVKYYVGVPRPYHQLTKTHKVLGAKQHGITASSSFEIHPVFLHSSSLFCHALWLLKLKDPKELVLRAIQGRGAQYYWM